MLAPDTPRVLPADSRARWRPFWLLAAALLLACGLTLWQGGFTVEAVRRVIRLTAQCSLLLFCAAFAAAALHRRWPGPLTRALRAHRRQVGVAFAFSHALHALALLALARMDPTLFAGLTDTGMYVAGGLAYAFLIAMTATSFDRSAAWLGPRAWKLLHTVGAHDIWLTFLVAEGKRALHDAAYWPAVGLLLLVIGLRLASRTTRVAAVTSA